MRKYQQKTRDISEMPYDARTEILTCANLSWTIHENIAYYHDHKEIGGELHEFLGVTEELLSLWNDSKLTDESLWFIIRKGRIRC